MQRGSSVDKASYNFCKTSKGISTLPMTEIPPLVFTKVGLFLIAQLMQARPLT